MKALVTGGAGFIGSHLAEALCRRGDNVVVLDDLSSGKIDNLAWRAPGDELEFVQGDAGDDLLLKQLLKDCDCVFHLAAMPSVQQSIIAPLESNRRNLETTLRLFVAARDAGVRSRRFRLLIVCLWRSKVQRRTGRRCAGSRFRPTPSRNARPSNTRQLFHRLYALPVVTLRYFNVFGPRQDYDSPYAGVVARFCKAILNSAADYDLRRRPAVA